MFDKTWQKIKALFDLPCFRMVRKKLKRSVFEVRGLAAEARNLEHSAVKIFLCLQS